MPPDDRLATPRGELRLERYPAWSRAGRRAWDAADELALLHVAEDPALAVRADRGPVVVVHGGQGAVAVALAGDADVLSIDDSYVDRLATQANLVANGRAARCTDLLDASLPGRLTDAALVVLKVPRTVALLEHTLAVLAPHLAPGTPVVGAGMTRHVHTSTVEAFERFVGATTTTPARKKARLLLASRAEWPPPPSTWPRTVDAGHGRVLVHHAGVFSADRLDAGTALLLAHLPDVAPGATVVDLGCGDGIVGTTVLGRTPDADVWFVDESPLAVASAEATAAANLGEPLVAARASGSVRFEVGDGLDALASGTELPDASVDLVLLNPPFHDDHVVGDGIAWQLFTQARRVLRPGGELRVVGNRHLGYHTKLRRRLGNAEVVASDPRFVVLSAVR